MFLFSLSIKIQYIIRALLQYTSEIQPQAKNGMFCTSIDWQILLSWQEGVSHQRRCTVLHRLTLKHQDII